MKHLFKLKKDGKTVGYAHINGYGQLMFRFPDDNEWHCRENFWTAMIERYGFGMPPCEYFSYVRDDKNGDPVFAGDEVKSWYPCGKLIAEDLIVKHGQPTASNFYNSANMNDIELIKEEQ